MTLNNTKNGLFRPWDEVRDSEITSPSTDDQDRVDSNLNLNYLRIDVKCEHPDHQDDDDDTSERQSLSPSPGASSSQSSSNVNDVEEEDSLRKLTTLVDETILGIPNTDKSNSVDSSSSCSETSFSTSSPVEDDLHPPRSAFVPTRLNHHSTYGFPGVSYPGVNQQHFETAGRLQLHHELIARQEHAVLDHFAAQQGQFALEEAARLLQHHEAIVKQNKKLRPKKFLCPHCDVAFSNNGQLKGHIRIHTGERPYKCDEEGCGKTFTRNEELTRHKRIHSGVRPHACPVCGKCFGRKDHLKKHARTHEMRGPAIYIPAPGPFPFPAAHPPLHPFIFGL